MVLTANPGNLDTTQKPSLFGKNGIRLLLDWEISMPIRVTLNRQLGIIEVNAHGVILISEMEEANGEILRIHREEGIDKVLGDATEVEEAPSTLESFEFWRQFPLGFRHALLFPESDPIGADARFIENVSVNRGRQLRAFESRERALRWLFEERSHNLE